VPQIADEDTAVKPVLWACITHAHVFAGSWPKIVE
jgi:hypothetical protein